MALLGIDICGAFVDRMGERFKGYLGTGEISNLSPPWNPLGYAMFTVKLIHEMFVLKLSYLTKNLKESFFFSCFWNAEAKTTLLLVPVKEEFTILVWIQVVPEIKNV